MFYGESSHVLDGKFRVTIPKRFQDELGRESSGESAGTLACFLARGQDRCLYLFTEKGCERALDSLNISAFNGENQRAAQRMVFANLARVELDAQGRVLVPEKLRAHLGTDKEVVIVGVGDHAEIWAADVWERYHAQHEPILDSVDQVLGRGRTGPNS